MKLITIDNLVRAELTRTSDDGERNDATIC